MQYKVAMPLNKTRYNQQEDNSTVHICCKLNRRRSFALTRKNSRDYYCRVYSTLVFPLVIVIITVVIRAAIITQRIKVHENRGKFVGGLIIRFEARWVFYICEWRAELKRDTRTPRVRGTYTPVHTYATGRNSLFFSCSHDRPPCQCVDALNWLVILIEFHYPPARQWTASFNEREWTGRAAAFSALDYRKTFHARLLSRRFKKRRQSERHKSRSRPRGKNISRHLANACRWLKPRLIFLTTNQMRSM